MDKQKGRKEYVRLRIRLARDKIKVAKLLFDNAKYRDVISRCYYAVFYAAKALLLAQGEDPSSHKGVDILFHRFCFTHKQLSENLAKIFSLMRQSRLNADYKEKVRITREDAKEALQMAKSFVKEIQSLLK
jgi:uncharacterized protein (UPF0332 family)